VRALIHEVVVDVQPSLGEIVLVIHWKGGVHTELRVPRRRRGQCSTQTSKEIVDAIGVLARVFSDRLIASALNRSGLRTGRGNYWTQERVTSLRSHHQIPVYSAEKRQAEGWIILTEAAKLIGVSPKTLRLAVERGEIVGEHPVSDGPWIFSRDALRSEAVTRLLTRVQAHRAHPALPCAQQDTLDFSMT